MYLLLDFYYTSEFYILDYFDYDIFITELKRRRNSK